MMKSVLTLLFTCGLLSVVRTEVTTQDYLKFLAMASEEVGLTEEVSHKLEEKMAEYLKNELKYMVLGSEEHGALIG